MAALASLAALALFASSTLAVPAPQLQGDQLITGPTLPSSVTLAAGGGLPNTAGVSTLSQAALDGFMVANFLENLESNFFQNALANLTAWGTAGTLNGIDNLDIVSHMAGQEEVHVANIERLLMGNGAQTVQPCQYVFPVTDAPTFFALANIITSVGIGALINLQASLATTDPAVIPALGSILPVESRHDAFLRLVDSEVPMPTPFDTRISPQWAYNLALDFTVPNSCLNLPSVLAGFPVFAPLALMGAGPPSFATPMAPGSLTFTVTQPNLLPQGWNAAPLFMGWVNQLNPPVYTPAMIQNGFLVADVPPGLNGMAFVALTNQNTATNVSDLTTATLAGPLPIPVS